MEFLSTPEFWVAVSFFIFLGALFYFGVHKKVATLLDARAAQIAKELAEAPAMPQARRGRKRGRLHHRPCRQ